MATLPIPHYFYQSAGRGGLEFVRPVLESFNLVAANKAHVYPPHQHFNYQLVCAQTGRYCCVLNGALIELAPKELLLVKRGDWHEDIFASPLTYLTVNFNLAGGDPGFSGDLIFASGVGPESQVLRGTNEDIWKLIERMQAESLRGDHFVVHVEDALLLQLFWWLVRSLPAEFLSPIFLQQSAAQAFSERLRRIFEQHLAENLSTAGIAAKLGVSTRTLTKRCQEVAGRHPARAFMQYKMDYAAPRRSGSDSMIRGLTFSSRGPSGGPELARTLSIFNP